MLAGIAERYQEKAGAEGGKVVWEGPTGVRVRGDKMELEQLFGNVVDNAVRHGPTGGTVRITVEERGGRYAVTVQDGGGEISEQDIKRLFDRFYRADASRTRATGGTGLGLSIAQEIAKRHGGWIEIVSKPELGTRVRVELPKI